MIAAAGPDGLEIIGIGEAPSTGMRKGVVTDLEETVRAIEAATEKAERMAGVHISHVYVGVTGEHIQSTNQPRRRRGLGRRSRSDLGRRPARRRRIEDHQPRGRPSDHSRVAAPLHDRRARRRHRSARHVRAAGSKSTHTSSPAARRSSRTCSSACTAPGSSPRASCSNRSHHLGRQRYCPKRSKSVACCSTSAAARPTSRCSRTAA